MATTLPPNHEQTLTDTVLFEVESDLDRRGHLGKSRMTISETDIRIYESTPAGEFEVMRLQFADISSPKTEQLVDAFAIVVKIEGKEVELLRSTNARTVLLSDACRRIELLLEEKPLPPLSERTDVCPKCGTPLGDESRICPYCVDRRQTLVRLFGYAKNDKGRILWGTLLTTAVTGMTLVPPYLTKLLVDNVLVNKMHNEFLPLMGLLAGSFLAKSFLDMARLRNIAFLGMRMANNIRGSLFEKIQSMSLSFYDRRSVGSLMSRMINDTGALYDVLVDGIPVILNQGALLIGIPIVLFVVNPRIAPYVLIPIPFVLIGVALFRKRMTKVWSRFWHNWSRFGSALNGILQGSRVVKAFHSENREVDRFDRRSRTLAKTQYVAESSWGTFFPAVVFTMSLSTLVVWWVGGLAVMHGTMTLGDITAFLAYVAMLNQPLMSLQRIIDWTTRALTAAERVFEIEDTPIDVAEAPDAVAMPNIAGNVTFKDVHFGYDKAREVLHGIDLDVKAGEIIGIVGHSGSGKSTLSNLITRFYDPTQGAIFIDGVDLTKVKLQDFRRQVGIVLQESYLFPGSVRSNIAYGRPEATLEDVIQAARAANAHHFIVNFPDGYDTYVGERGQRLSGGERQRIAIARAILHNPKVLILDEATASVDTETERMIQEALERLVAGRTVFAIAHRLSTLRNASRLIVLDSGKIVEVGTHDELLQLENGIYKKLVDMQQEVNKIQQNFLVE